MKKWICVLTALFLLACGTLGGCGKLSAPKKNTGEQSTAYAIYYLNADETELVRSAYEPKEETKEVMIQEMMRLLKEQTPKNGNLTLLPDGVYMTTYDIHEKTLTIDFNTKYLKMKPAREVLVRGGIVKMFLQVPGIVYVHFTVDGKELTDSKGQEIGLMSNDTFVDQAGKDINSYQYTTLILYFTNQTGDKLIPEKRSVYYNSNVSLERVVLDQLLKGPREGENSPTLPSNVNVLGATSADGNCYVNFDQVFTDGALAVQENIPIYSVVNSLVDTCKVKKVQISVNGETNITFRETMRLDKFYEKNTEIVEETEAENLPKTAEDVAEAEPSAAEEPVVSEVPRAANIVTAAPARDKAKAPGK
ncbi:MAG: GerMN domain-containing protein [Blautia sp.]|jgi:germination protein M